MTYKSRCSILVCVLVASLVVAVICLPGYRQNRFIVLLRPFVEARNSVLSSASGEVDGLQQVLNDYPSLISRIHNFHKDLDIDFRNTLERSTRLELAYLRSMAQYRALRQQVETLVRGSCPLADPTAPPGLPPALPPGLLDDYRSLVLRSVPPGLPHSDLFRDILPSPYQHSRAPNRQSSRKAAAADPIHESAMRLSGSLVELLANEIELADAETAIVSLSGSGHPSVRWKPIDANPEEWVRVQRWASNPWKNCRQTNDEEPGSRGAAGRAGIDGQQLPCACGKEKD